jgi:hypothetical protein
LQTIDTLERTSIERARARSLDDGIWAHSSPRSYLIFCVGQKDHQIKRFIRYALKTGLGFKPLRGCYQGKEERSFIINAKDHPRIKNFVMGQETVLFLHDYNRADVPKATLIHLQTGKQTELGLFVMGTDAVRKTHQSWTFDPLSGWYFVTEWK